MRCPTVLSPQGPASKRPKLALVPLTPRSRPSHGREAAPSQPLRTWDAVCYITWMSTFFTIGHSTRPLAVFADLLQAAKAELVADVRTVPRSARAQGACDRLVCRRECAAMIAVRHLQLRPYPRVRFQSWH